MVQCYHCQGPHYKGDCPNLTCFKCRKSGHKSFECRMNYIDTRYTQVIDNTCYKCGEEGHKSFKCSKNKLKCYGCGGDHFLRECPHEDQKKNIDSLKIKVMAQYRVCQDSLIDVIFIDCGHVCSCMNCMSSLVEEDKGCPICQSTITRIKKIVWP